MGFKNTVIVRHIRGEQFSLEVERDADCLGLKLLIFEAKGIPIERQRLVYAGKEIRDTDVLIALGIESQSTVYLVETNGGDIEAAAAIAVAPQPQNEAQVSPVAVQVSVQTVQPVVSPAPEAVPNAGNLAGYAQLNPGELGPNGEQILVLNRAAHKFFFFGLVLSVLSLAACLFSIIPIAVLSMGLYATRKVKPLWLWGVIGLFKLLALALIIGSIAGMVFHWCPFELVGLAAGLMFAVISASIFKLFILLNRCNNQQLQALRSRIDAAPKRCCGAMW